MLDIRTVKNVEPKIGEAIIIPKVIESGWGDVSHIIFEIGKVEHITPKKREVKVSNGMVLKPSDAKTYRYLVANEENMQLVHDSRTKMQAVEELGRLFQEVDTGYRKGVVYNSMETEQLTTLIEALKPYHAMIKARNARMGR